MASFGDEAISCGLAVPIVSFGLLPYLLLASKNIQQEPSGDSLIAKAEAKIAICSTFVFINKEDLLPTQLFS